MIDALSPELAEIADTAQRKVQEAQPQLKAIDGIAAARQTALAFLGALSPVKAAAASTLPGEIGSIGVPLSNGCHLECHKAIEGIAAAKQTA